MDKILKLYNSKFKPEEDYSREYLRVLGERLQTLRNMIEEYIKNKEATFKIIFE